MQYKSLHVVQIIQRSKNHSMQYKSFNAAQIIIERCVDFSNLSPNLLIINTVIKQSWKSLILALFMET